MDDYREIFNREIKRLNYLYVKANTKSKKKNMAYDLIFLKICIMVYQMMGKLFFHGVMMSL